ncbi:leishmanolysin-related zinc metalloendopeptidase [Nocardia harenae]|uniref:leishmanolysin-related zinc metalloendopeptidase n=1 Tax=Nocardia harenae TaxID=358707 RepID=UPI000829B4DD|nr:leishmanolysin-related zinc metalloendopeptidase [Nocardia harenae]
MTRTATHSHFARADRVRAQELALTDSPFTIEVRFVGGLTDSQEAAFAAAADRWATLIVGDLPEARIPDGAGGTIAVDDVLIFAEGRQIDGPGTILGQAGPTWIRRDSLLPIAGEMTFDSADLAGLEADGRLGDTITHEMGHVLGIGSLWSDHGLLRDAGTDGPVFVGPSAMDEYGALTGSAAEPVPVEDKGGPGTAGAHWRDAVFGTELMTGFISAAGIANPISRITVGSLADMGYLVDVAAADPFTLPDLLAVRESGLPERPARSGYVLPTLPRRV